MPVEAPVEFTEEAPEPAAGVVAIVPTRAWGRKVKYRSEYCDMIVDWMIERTQNRKISAVHSLVHEKGEKPSEKTEYRAISAEIPFLTDFAYQIGVSIDTLQNWARDIPAFGAAYARARELQESFVVRNAAEGLIPPNTFAFIMKNMFRRHPADGAKGWSDGREVTVTAPEVIDPRPELASVPAATLELMKLISKALSEGLDPEDYTGFRLVLEARAERRAARAAGLEAGESHENQPLDEKTSPSEPL